jgi:hypothetical protein
VGGVALCKFSPIREIGASAARSPPLVELLKILELGFNVGCRCNNLYLFTATDQARNINETMRLERTVGRNMLHAISDLGHRCPTIAIHCACSLSG